MGKPQRKKGNPSKNKSHHRLLKGKHYGRDMDLIYEDLQKKNMNQYKTKPDDELLPGLGQFYCVPCARHCQNKASLQIHEQSKPHKRRVKLLKEKPYDHKEAELLNR